MRSTLLSLFAFTHFLLHAQEPCGSPEPDMALRTQLAQLAQARGGEELQDLTIPVVFHMIHEGQPIGSGPNKSLDYVLDLMDCINSAFRGETGTGVDTRIQFCLASVDPDGNTTDGITRTNGLFIDPTYGNGVHAPITAPCPELMEASIIMDATRWPDADYLNIWVMNSICGAAGVGWGPSYPVHGVMVRYNEILCPPSSTMIHELGHACGLFHTFTTDSGPCYAETDCSFQGDQCCDTPFHRRYDCDADVSACEPELDTEFWRNTPYNYMSYCAFSWDLRRFTQDQAVKMHLTMEEYAPQLLASNACGLSTGISPQRTPVPLSVEVEDGVLRFTSSSIGTAHIHDAAGRCAMAVPLVSGSASIDVHALATGLYVLSLESGETSARTARFIVQ